VDSILLKPYVKPSAKIVVYFIILIIYLKNSLNVRKCLGKIRKIIHKNYFKLNPNIIFIISTNNY